MGRAAGAVLGPPADGGPETGGPVQGGRAVARWRARPDRRQARFPTLLKVVVTVVVALIVVVPLGTMAVASLRPAGQLPFGSGGFTFDAYRSMWSLLIGGRVLTSTLTFALGSLVLGLVIAFPIAFVSERTDFRFKRTLYVLMFVPMSIPPFALALGWVLLANPENGLVNSALQHALGLSGSGPINIYSMLGLIFVEGIGMVPSVWLVLISVLRHYDPSQDEAARTSGASSSRVFTRVTLPVMRPGIGAVAILFFMAALQQLDIAIALAPAAKIPLLPVVIFDAIQPSGTSLPNYSLASSFGMLTVAVGVVGILAYMRLIRSSARFETVGGRGGERRLVALGRYRYLVTAGISLFAVVAVVLPVGVLVYASFLKYYVPLGSGPQWTVSNFTALATYAGFGRYFVNTLVVAVGASALATVLAVAIAWLVVRHSSRWTKTLNTLAFCPLAIPGTIMCLAFFVATLQTPLFQSLLVMGVAETAIFLPFATRIVQGAQMQISPQLEEAARVGGAGAAGAFRTANLPLLRGSLWNAGMWVFVHTAKTFAVGLILASGTTALVANQIYSQYDAGYFPSSAAMMMVLVVFNSVLMLAVSGRLYRSGGVAGAVGAR